MMDSEKVIKGLNEIGTFITGRLEYGQAKNLLEFLDEAIAMLKEKEAIKPYIDIDEAKCPICKVKLTRQELLGEDVLFEDFFDYCPSCGRKVKWQ